MSDPSSPSRKTDFLNLPPGTEMSDRISGNNTGEFAEDMMLEIHMDGLVVKSDVLQDVYVGRAVEGDPTPVDVDLTPKGAYQNGVSRRHAVFRRHDDGLYVEDLRSTNGTRINGSQLTADREYRLRDGDEIEFARVRATVHFIVKSS